MQVEGLRSDLQNRSFSRGKSVDTQLTFQHPLDFAEEDVFPEDQFKEQIGTEGNWELYFKNEFKSKATLDVYKLRVRNFSRWLSFQRPSRENPTAGTVCDRSIA